MLGAMAWLAFFCHAPGLWLFHRFTLGPRTKRENLVAVVMTLLAMGVAFAATQGWSASFAAWLLGHVAWGAWLARRVHRGEAAR